MHRLRRIDVIALVVGSIIGWGSFTLPGSRFLRASGVIDTALGLAIGAGMVIFIQAGYHVMMRLHADEGGEFSYTYERLGRAHGFIVGWSLLLAYISLVGLNGTAFVLVLKRIFGDAVSVGYLYSLAGYPVHASDVAIASAIMIAFAWLNVRGLRGSSRTQNLLVVFLVVNVVSIFLLMLFVVDLGPFTATYVDGWSVSWARVGSVVAIVPFLFVGFDVIPQVARDLGFEPHRATRLAIIGIAVGALLYAVLNMLTGLVFRPDQVDAVTWPTGAAVQSALGPVGLAALIIALAGAVLGGINAFTLASSKLIASLAEHRFLAPRFAQRNDVGVFHRAVWFVLAISLVAPWAGREVVNYIVNMCSALTAVAYLYTCLISVQATDRARARVMSGIGALCAVGFLSLLFWPTSSSRLGTLELIALAVWVAGGAVVYVASGRRATAPA